MSDKGLALPLAVVSLMILTVVLIALIVLATSEPPIASNHARAAQARAFAHAGIENALWVLGRPEVGTAAHDGTHFTALGPAGGFFVKLTSVPGAEHERAVEVNGWAPGPPAPDLRARAHRRIRSVLARLPFRVPPAAVSVAGDVRVHGTSRIQGGAGECGARPAVVATGDVHLLDSAEVASSDPGASAALGSQPTTLMDALAFTAAELDLLRALARCCGTYVGPGSPPTWLAAPRITFDGGTRLPAGGLVFVDTRSGINPTASTETADLAEVTVGHDAALAATAGFRGWLIVNGNLRWQSSASAGGLVYAQAGLTWSGEGALAGNVVVRNVTGASAAVEIGPSASIAFDCGAARSGGGTVPSGWFVKPGSYREVSD